MDGKRIYRVRWLLLLLAVWLGCPPLLSAQEEKVDSVARLLPRLSGAEKVAALDEICDLAYGVGDGSLERGWLHAFIGELLAQDSYAIASRAYTQLFINYYNSGMGDSLLARLPDVLAFQAKHESWDRYYECWVLVVEELIFEVKYFLALDELKRMHAHAQKHGHTHGLGKALYGMGYAYDIGFRNYEEAEPLYEEAIETFESQRGYDDTYLVNSYMRLCDLLDRRDKHDKLRHYATRWLDLVKAIDRRHASIGLPHYVNESYFYCYLGLAKAEVRDKNLQQAAVYFRKADSLRAYSTGLVNMFWYADLSKFYELQGDFSMAMRYNDSLLAICDAPGSALQRLVTQEARADLLFEMGRYAESASLYHRTVPARDSLNSLTFSGQLNELQTIYRVSELKAQQRILRLRLWAIVAVCVLLLLAIALYTRYTRQLRKKNRALYEKIRQQQRAEEREQSMREKVPAVSLSREQVLFGSLSRIMEEQKLYTNPTLSRREMAEAVGTNTTYLSDAVKACTDGMTISEYLNRMRLNWAGKMLVEAGDMAVDIVGEQCGFSSRSTFYRLFRDYYGMSPGEFRRQGTSYR